MCLELKTKPEIKVAEENIFCYKTCDKHKDMTGKYLRANYDFIYREMEVTPFQHFGIHHYSNWGGWSVEEGYHSVMEVNEYENGTWSKRELFVIPKGALYIEGGDNHSIGVDAYVSSHIVWVGTLPIKGNWFNSRSKKVKKLYEKAKNTVFEIVLPVNAKEIQEQELMEEKRDTVPI